MGRVAVLLLLVAAARGDDEIVRRDHGKRTGKQSVAASGHAIALETGADRPYVRSVLVHGARYGEGYDPTAEVFEVAVCDADLSVLARFTVSYTEFSQHIFTWVEVPLPVPVRVPPAFRVVVDFHPTATKGVYVGYADVGRGHSSYYRIGEKEQPFAKGKEWMIRARTSASKEPLARPARNPREVLRKAAVPALAAGDLAAALARVSEAAGVPVVLDTKDAVAVCEVPAGTAESTLDRLAEAGGLGWDVRWGIVYVATEERLEGIPLARPEPESDAPTPPAVVALRTELARRPVELACHDLALEKAVAQVSSWLELRAKWDGSVDRRQTVTLDAKCLRACDALSLLLLPRGCGYRVVEGGIEIVPLGE